MSTVPATTSAAKPTSLIQVVRTGIQKMEKEFATALPGHLKPEKFVRTVLTAVQSNPDILRSCTTPDGRHSLYQSAMKAAADGLLPDGREAAFVVFNNKVKIKGADGREREEWRQMVQYMPMAQGLMKTMRNTGEIASIAATVVYANDSFRYIKGDDERIEHDPAPLDAEPGDPIGAYCIITLKDGTKIREVMRKAEIEKVRAVSKAKNAGTWTQWWEEMARKTVLRRAYKYAPKSADVDQMLERDNESYDLDQHQQHHRHSAAAILNGLGSAAGAGEMAHDQATGEVIDGDYSEAAEEDVSLEEDRQFVNEGGKPQTASPDLTALKKTLESFKDLKSLMTWWNGEPMGEILAGIEGSDKAGFEDLCALYDHRRTALAGQGDLLGAK